MKVGIVNPHNIDVYQFGKPKQTEPEADNINLDLPKEGELAQTTPTVPEANNQDNDTEESKGVVRLLQEGHFKGVADVRLRINFYDELAGIENSQLKAVAGEKIDDVFEAVETSVNSLLETDTLTDEQLNSPMENFSQAVTQAKDEFLSSDSPSKEALANTLKSAFEVLTTSINEIINPTAAENPPLPVEIPEGEPTSSDQSNTTPDLIENLTTVFTTALNELISNFDEIQVLPDLSGPTGNGGAYDKFLAIYNELKGVETQQTDSQDNKMVDIVG